MTKTKGIWKVVPSSHKQEWSHWIIAGQNDMVAAITERDESEANARLIASAPELLEALEALLLEALEALTISAKDAISEDPHKDWKHSCWDGIDLAESVIAQVKVGS